MARRLVLRGHMRWIAPLVLIVLAMSLAHYAFFWEASRAGRGMLERMEDFPETSQEALNAETARVNNKSTIRRKSMDEVENDMEEAEKVMEKAMDDAEKQMQTAEKQQRKKKVAKPETDESDDDTEVVENFDMEVLPDNWRTTPMAETLKPYNGPIMGFNCRDYSEFAFDSARSPCVQTNKCRSTWIYPTDDPNDYIFPNKVPYKGEVPLAPFSLQGVEDAYDARTEANMIAQFDPILHPRKANDDRKRLPFKDADTFSRPNYLYHRNSGKRSDSIISQGI